MTMCIIIEPACVDDAEAISALDQANLHGGWSAFAVAKLLLEWPGLSQVARAGSALAGFALCRIAADECEVLRCAVDANARRRGTGRLLLQSALREVGRRGGVRAFLEVATDNAPALAFYTALGFAAIGRRRHYYQPPFSRAGDALIMGRDL